MSPTRTEAIREMAAALERADASARVLGARARAARDGAGPAAAFAALAEAGPDGLVPAVGTGGMLAARHLEHAAMAAAAAGPALPPAVADALARAVAATRAQAGGANALDPRGVAAAVRHEVAAVRGTAADSMPRDHAWQVLRLGTFLPRAAWMCALLLACAAAAQALAGASDGERAVGPGHATALGDDAVWNAAALVAGIPRAPGTDVLVTLMTDTSLPASVAHALDEVTSALFALSRRGVMGSAPLALARATTARIGSAAERAALAADPRAAIKEALDAIGAIAGIAIPSPGREGNAHQAAA